ncbi:MAG: ABC transporter substrate-binding protein, partial [Actinobacteria bacterium]|nr:ABC transporter substrate-binding protein [Actinomycetota bacterium]
MGKANIGLRSVVLVTGVALAAAACGGSSGGGGTGGNTGAGGGGKKGGTITFLDSAKQFNHLDPQRNYT